MNNKINFISYVIFIKRKTKFVDRYISVNTENRPKLICSLQSSSFEQGKLKFKGNKQGISPFNIDTLSYI